jgi:hypothetical protein
MTIGKDRVRVKFNPNGDNVVDQIKQRTARLIDACEDMRDSGGSAEKNRLLALAQTAYEEAAMWAVKAATYESG